MFFHVLLTVNCGSETFVTKWALVWFHAHVGRHMSRKASISGKGCIANTATERFNS